MKTNEVKQIVVKHLNRLIGEWFGDKPIIQAIAKTALQANINKYDNLLVMLTDENGNLLVDELITNLGINNGVEVDLSTISPLLPNRVVIISKSDIDNLLADLNKS